MLGRAGPAQASGVQTRVPALGGRGTAPSVSLSPFVSSGPLSGPVSAPCFSPRPRHTHGSRRTSPAFSDWPPSIPSGSSGDRRSLQKKDRRKHPWLSAALRIRPGLSHVAYRALLQGSPPSSPSSPSTPVLPAAGVPATPASSPLLRVPLLSCLRPFSLHFSLPRRLLQLPRKTSPTPWLGLLHAVLALPLALRALRKHLWSVYEVCT